MTNTRSTAIAAAAVAMAALAAAGITYAAASSEQAAQPPPAVPQAAAPPQAPLDGFQATEGNVIEGKGNEGGGRRHEERRRHREGRIHINERSYTSDPGDCITVVSGLGAKTLNIRNDTHKTVEVFRGVVCDNGAPLATVGPHSSSEGVIVQPTDGIFVDDGVVASFRVIEHDEDYAWA